MFCFFYTITLLLISSLSLGKITEKNTVSVRINIGSASSVTASIHQQRRKPIVSGSTS